MRGITRTLGALFAASALAAPVWAGVVDGEPDAVLIASFDGNNNVSATSGQTQWFTSWGGEGPAAYITSPNTKGFVVVPGAHPWVGLTAMEAASCAIYADISGVDASSQSKFIAVFGNAEGHIALMKTGANTVQVWQNKAVITGTSADEATPAPTLSVESAALASGYHLIVFGYSASGAFLSVDGTTTVSVSTTVAQPNAGFQIGSIYQGLNTWTSGPSVAQGYGMKIDEVRGYTGTLSDTNISDLATAFRASTVSTADLSAETAATYGSLTWSPASAPTEGGYAKIIAGAGTTLTMDTATPALAELTISGGALTVEPDAALAEGTTAVSASQTLIQANTDLSAVTASLGGVYIWADKRLTVRSLSHLGATPSVSGMGTSAALAVKLATAETAETLGYQPRNTFVLAQGKLSVGGAKLVNASTIRIEGTGSRMICTENDPMNSGGTYAGKLELADGAILETQKHTRLPQTVEVSGPGSQVQITGTNGDNWRAVSLRTVKLNENATATFTRAGDKATSDEAGFHLWNTTVNAAAGATLTIDAPLMKGCNNNGLNDNETSLTKTGAGELIVTAPSVASTFKLPACRIAVNAGTMTLKPAAGETPDFGSASITVASGAELAYAGEGASTVSMAVSGAGALKAKSGTVAFSNLSGFTGTATASAGTLDLYGTTFGETMPTLAVESGATLILPAGKESGVTLASGASLKLVLSSAQLSAVYTPQVSEADRSKVTLQKVGSDGQLTDITTEDGTVTDGVFTPAMTTWTPTATETDGSYSWSNTSNWSKGLPTSTSPASIKVSEATTIVLPADATCSALYVNGPATLTLSGSAPTGLGTLTVVGNASVPVALANAVSSIAVEAGYTLTLDAGANGATLTKAIAVAGAIKKVGSGTLTLGADLAPNGGTTVAEGTLAFGAGVIPSTSGAYSSAGDVTVEGGATLDVAGVGDSFLRVVTLKRGATYANSSTTSLGSSMRQLGGIVLEGDATVAATRDFGILKGDFAAAELALNGHTLTKTGAGNFWLCNTTVSGGGTLKVEEGTIKSVQSNCTINDAIVFDCGSSSTAFDFAGQQVTVNGSVTKRGTGIMTCDAILAGDNKLLTVEAGTLKLTKANTRRELPNTCTEPTTIVKTGATLDISTAGATLYAGNDTFGGNQNGASVLVQGKLITREWCYNQALGSLRTNTPTLSIDGGTVEFSTNISAETPEANRRAFTVTANGATLVARKDVTVALNRENAIVNNGTLKLEGAGAFVVSEAIPGTVTVSSTIGGTGTFSGTLTFNDGATLDASAGALTAGTVAFAENATVTVTGATTDGKEILKCSNPAAVAAKFTGAPAGLFFAKKNAENIVVLVAPTVDLDTGVSGELSTEAQAALAKVAADNRMKTATVSGSTTVDGAAKTLTAAEIDNVLAVFGDSVVTADTTNNTLKVDYNFGIVAVEPYYEDGNLQSFIVKVKAETAAGDAATLASGVALSLVDSESEVVINASGIGFMGPDANGIYAAGFSSEGLIGRSFKVRAQPVPATTE